MNETLRTGYEELARLLKIRLETIGDTGFRDRDPEGHLERLKGVSEAIFSRHQDLKGRIPPRLDHFLTGCSYQKALAFLENELNG